MATTKILGQEINALTAATASFALAVAGGGGGAAFPFTGSARITGSLGVTGSLSNGSGNIASGIFSHAEGQYTIASGSYSHAEGYSTTAKGLNSHAEGNQTFASGGYSHAEGFFATATGYASHAEGGGFSQYYGANIASTTPPVEARGAYSHVEGYGITMCMIMTEKLSKILDFLHQEKHLTPKDMLHKQKVHIHTQKGF